MARRPEGESTLEAILEAIWGESGDAFGAKIDLGCDLKSPFKRNCVLIPFRARFGTPFPRFLRSPGRPKTMNKRQEDDSISEPSKP